MAPRRLSFSAELSVLRKVLMYLLAIGTWDMDLLCTVSRYVWLLVKPWSGGDAGLVCGECGSSSFIFSSGPVCSAEDTPCIELLVTRTFIWTLDLGHWTRTVLLYSNLQIALCHSDLLVGGVATLG